MNLEHLIATIKAHKCMAWFRATEELESLSSAYWIGAAFAVAIEIIDFNNDMTSRIADVNADPRHSMDYA